MVRFSLHVAACLALMVWGLTPIMDSSARAQDCNHFFQTHCCDIVGVSDPVECSLGHAQWECEHEITLDEVIGAWVPVGEEEGYSPVWVTGGVKIIGCKYFLAECSPTTPYQCFWSANEISKKCMHYPAPAGQPNCP